MTEREEALEPCPFCGGEASRQDLTDDDNAGGSCIACDRCGASSPVHFDRKENLYDSWNRRASSPPPKGGEGWRDIESAPKDGRHVLLYFPKGYWGDDRNIAIGFWGQGNDWFEGESDSRSMTEFGSQPTKWQPLPAAPDGKAVCHKAPT